MQLFALTVAALSVVGLSSAHLEHSASHLHGRSAGCQLGTDHLRPRDEHGQPLARRQLLSVSGNGMPYPEPGAVPPENSLPKAWLDKYREAKAAGLIPDTPRSVLAPSGANPYPPGTNMRQVCSWTATKCNDGDIYLAPPNHVAFGVDDGVTPEGTTELIKLMAQKKFSVTHFLIGSAIAWNPDVFKQLAATSPPPHLAVHTWSHTLQTTKTDLEVLGDLGWTQQIIYDMTGVIPMYWRPPQGDADARVRAIAKHVLGMQTVLWNHDANDWCLRQGTGTAKGIETCETLAPDLATVTKNQVAWVTGTNGTGVLSLNHETTDQGIKAFGALYDAAVASTSPKWTVSGTVPDLNNLPWYLNQFGPNDKPTKQDNILPTRDFIELPDGGLGSVPYKLGNWAALAHGGSGSGSSARNGTKDASSSSSTHGSGTTGSSSGTSSARTGSSSSGTNGTSTTSGAAGRSMPVAMLVGSAAIAAALLA